MKVLFFITSNPFSKDLNTIIKLIQALKSKEHFVSMFFSGNGVYWLLRQDIESFLKDVEISYCAHSAKQRGVSPVISGAQSSSSYDIFRRMEEFDKVLAFN